MTLLLLSEGPLDLGDEHPFDPNTGSAGRAGSLRPLILALIGQDWVQIQGRRLPRVHGAFDGRHSGLSADGRRLCNSLGKDSTEKFDGVIVVVDQDHGPGGARRRSNLEAGRAAAGEAGERIPCAIGTAQTMVESWLMGDSGACRRAFGRLPTGWPADPEAEAGPKRSPTYPKTRLRALLEEAGADITRRVESYGELAEAIDVTVLRSTCHRSFAPFAEDVENEILPLYADRATTARGE